MKSAIHSGARRTKNCQEIRTRNAAKGEGHVCYRCHSDCAPAYTHVRGLVSARFCSGYRCCSCFRLLNLFLPRFLSPAPVSVTHCASAPVWHQDRTLRNCAFRVARAPACAPAWAHVGGPVSASSCPKSCSDSCFCSCFRQLNLFLPRFLLLFLLLIVLLRLSDTKTERPETVPPESLPN